MTALPQQLSSVSTKKSERFFFQPKQVERKNIYSREEYKALCDKIDEINPRRSTHVKVLLDYIVKRPRKEDSCGAYCTPTTKAMQQATGFGKTAIFSYLKIIEQASGPARITDKPRKDKKTGKFTTNRAIYFPGENGFRSMFDRVRDREPHIDLSKKSNTKVLDKESPKPSSSLKKKPDKPKKPDKIKKPSMKEKLRRTVICLRDSKEYLKSKGLTVHCTGTTLEFEGTHKSWKEFKVLDMSQLSASDSNFAIRNHLWHFGIPDTAAKMIVMDHKVPECDMLTEKARYDQSARAQAEKKGLSEKQIHFMARTQEEQDPDFVKMREEMLNKLDES